MIGSPQRRGAPADLAELDVDGVLSRPDPVPPGGRAEHAARDARAPRRGLPLFGVCLGHQAIGAVFGAPIVRAPELLHGKTSEILHDGTGVLAGLPSPFTATRYHSLAVDEAALPEEIIVTGRTASGVVMALRHRTLPIDGVQFHPESVLTTAGIGWWPTGWSAAVALSTMSAWPSCPTGWMRSVRPHSPTPEERTLV